MSKPGKDSSIQIPVDVLTKLLTPSEWRMLKNRFQIMNLLEDGLSVRKIAERIKVGTDTVVRTIRTVERNNTLATPKKEKKKIKTSTPWIFGKSD